MQFRKKAVELSTSMRERLDGLYGFFVERGLVVSSNLAEELARITHLINKEIAVYINRRGKVVHVAVGNDHTVPLEKVTGRRSPNKLSGIRCIHTHPGEDGELSPVDITALEILKFDCMVALGVLSDGTLGTVGVGFLKPGLGKTVIHTVFPGLQQLCQWDYLAAVAETEKVPFLEEMSGPEKALLIGLENDKSRVSNGDYLVELEQLALSAGLKVVGRERQRRNKPDAATYLGPGKAKEIQLFTQVLRADVVVFDDELSPAQQRNLEELIGLKCIDRTMLILDIFAQRAWSNEGKIQVELAQLKYLLPRLTGQGLMLSRLGGGIGTRGPGETKLELDRRKIRKRIIDLEKRLEVVRRARALHRKRWEDLSLPVVSLVGYTNAGKSTLINCLTGADVKTENKLFATLDPTTRMGRLPDGRAVLFTDTVGFIQKLPHHLVAAFRATLEETLEADVLVHVLDGSSQYVDDQALAVNQVLKELGAVGKPMVTTLNKIDMLENDAVLTRLLRKYEAIGISATKNTGTHLLLEKIQQSLPEPLELIKATIPFHRASLVRDIYQHGRVIYEMYSEEGIKIEAYVNRRLKGLLAKNN